MILKAKNLHWVVGTICSIAAVGLACSFTEGSDLGQRKDKQAINPSFTQSVGTDFKLVKNWDFGTMGNIRNISEMNASEFMDSVKMKGFNTLMISVISADSRFAGNPPNWKGNFQNKISRITKT